MASSSSSSSTPQRQSVLYFAFGSNMHLGQMAKRCPESRYVGIAKLHKWRFQINNRRYANVVFSPGSYVEGLVYRLSVTDEANLDKSEGVPTAYQKYNLAIELFTTPVEHVARAVPELAKELEASEPYITNENRNSQRPASRNQQSQAPGRTRGVDNQPGFDNSGGLQRHSLALAGQHTNALVYLSTNHVQEGKPWDEYIDRMNSGIIDARKLGLSEIYITHCLRRYIKDRALPSQVLNPARRTPRNHYQRPRESSPTRPSFLGRRNGPRGRISRSMSTRPATRTYDTRDNEPDRYAESRRHHNDRRRINSRI